MEREFGDKLNELDLTNDEIKRLSDCMKDEKFMDLLRDYALEISNPENKKKYEEEIAMMEKERGNDVKFIHPSPGHVLKTSLNGDKKCFINICSSEEIGKPVSKPSVKGSSRGMQWSIPHSLSQPREDIDKAGAKCMVYDVIFNPDTYHMAQKNGRFRKMVHDMALDAVERLFKVKLDKVNVKKPKMTFKGLPQASIVRTPSEDTRELNAKSEEDPDDPLRFPYPPMSNGPVQKDAASDKENKPDEEVKGHNDNDMNSEFVEPKYTLTHRGYFDMKNYYTIPDYEVVSTRPRELVLNIELPMLKAASALHLEIFEERIFLECAKPVKYKLYLKLPFPVDDSKGHARFDKSKRKLTITLEVLPPKIQQSYRISKLSDQENACGSCSHKNEKESAQNLEDGNEVTGEENPSENELLPSDHPSGLIHGRSRCRHQNHGELWGENYDEKDDTRSKSKMNFLMKASPSLIEKLVAESSFDKKSTALVKKRPKIQYHQDETFVTIIVDVKSIESEKLWYVLSRDNLQLCCVSSDCSHVIYQLFVKFQDGETIDPRRSRIDVSDDNAVFLLRKYVGCEHEWQTFKAGFDGVSLKALYFATENNVNTLITSVTREALNSVMREFDCEDVSGAQNPELLVLKLLPKEVTDEIRLSVNEKENGEVVDDLPLMHDTLQKLGDVRKNTGDDRKIDHRKLLLESVKSQKPQSPDTDSETDEDDDSDTYETADSSEEDPQRHDSEKTAENQAERAEPLGNGCEEAQKSLIENRKENCSHDSQAKIDSTTPESRKDDEELSNGVRQLDETSQSSSNEPLVLREYDKGDETEGKTKVVTDHKTRSVIRLNNDMLFEIDSD